MNPAWIQHESSMNPAWMDFFNILTPQNSKPPIQNTIHTNLVRFFWPFFFQIFIESDSCRFHAGFKHNQTWNFILQLVSDSCQIHAEFIHFQWFLDLVLNWRVFSKILVQIWLGRGWFWNHVEFMLNSCWFHFYLEFSQRFVQHFASQWCWIHVFMLNSCWIQAKPWKAPKFANKGGLIWSI